jgi:FkbM family methyltransferase
MRVEQIPDYSPHAGILGMRRWLRSQIFSLGIRIRDRCLKPELIYRLFYGGYGSNIESDIADGIRIVTTPWGLPLEADSRETIGRALVRFGIYDLAVSEALWRLIEPGTQVVDVGANIGYMTSVMAVRSGPEGRTIAYEPHPDVARRLERNLNLWMNKTRLVKLSEIELRQEAVSDQNGLGLLRAPQNFSTNRGLAYLVDDSPQISDISVQRVCLDSAFANCPEIALLKVDVEGHELQVFKGAESLLARGGIRHIIFEEHNDFPTPTTKYLSRFGYTIFQIGVGLFGPSLGAGDAINRIPRRRWEPRSMIGTINPAQIVRAFARRGWQVLKGF